MHQRVSHVLQHVTHSDIIPQHLLSGSSCDCYYFQHTYCVSA